MKAHLGMHQKWTVRPAHRTAIHALMTRGLGASEGTPPDASFDLFELEGGAVVGVEMDDGALDEEAARKGAWLEFLVADPEATARALDALSVKRIDYRDKEHAYFQAPGGPVFRLART
ncbi:MAG TPA: hypothetical protein VGH87_07485 [Polyangiaceae bacterium]